MTNGADAYGKSAWSWLSLLQSSFRGGSIGPTGRDEPSIREATVTKRNSSPGRARHKPSTHCAGKAGMSRLSRVLPVHFAQACRTGPMGASRRPVFPAPSLF